MALTSLNPNLLGTDSSGASKLSSAGGLVQLHATGVFTIANTTANSFAVTNTGIVGIGTNSPISSDGGNSLEISNSNNTVVTITATNDTTPLLNFRSNSVDRLQIQSSSNWGAYFLVRSNQDMRLGTNNALRAVISANGNVGIGTSSPSDKLVVSGNVTMSGNLLTVGDYTTNTTLTFQSYNSGLTKINFYDNNSTEGLYMKTVGDNYGGVMSFGARWDDDEDKVTLKMYQSSGGASYNVRVGVGTTSPIETLDVVGSINIRNDLDGSQGYTGGYRFTRTAANTAAYIQNGGNGGGMGMTSGEQSIPTGTTTMIARTHWGGLILVGYAGSGQQGYRIVSYGYGGSPTVLYSTAWVGGASITFSVADYRLLVNHNAGNNLSFWSVFLGV